MNKAASEEANRRNRIPITASIMLAALMTAIDGTIANVALPHIQGSLSASSEQSAWVLTSYIISAAIAMPLSGQLADRIGRKRLFIVCIAGFTVTSILCGLAGNIGQIVVFRALQGLFGAAITPLSQSTLLDIHTPARRGPAMALWSASTMMAPVVGPVLGGWLTDQLSWRWVFLINLPIGLVTLLGVLRFMAETPSETRRRLDLLGYGSLAVAVASLQLMLDRGASQDWFLSREIWAYLIVAAISCWIFCVQIATSKQPFIPHGLLADRNFITASVLIFVMGMLVFSMAAQIPGLMQNVLAYTAGFSGQLTVPRGLTACLSMLLSGYLVSRIDPRLQVLAGALLMIGGLWPMTYFSLTMDIRPMLVTGALLGFSIGIISVPLTITAFATLKPEYRTDGAAISSLIRNLGASVGISVMQARIISNTQVHHAALALHARADSAIYGAYLSPPYALDTAAGLAALNRMITRQAELMAYVDNFQLMAVLVAVSMPLILLLRPPKRESPGRVAVASADKAAGRPR